MWDFLKRNKKKKRKPKKIKVIDRANLKAFLKEVSRDIDNTFSGAESKHLQKIFEMELQNWLRNTLDKGKPLDPVAVKIGIVLGLGQALRKVNEAETHEKVTYIS